MEFVRIPGGEFLMGAPDDEKGADSDERPQHSSRISKDFYLGKFEVTQDQYTAVTGDNPSVFKGGRLPVENVSWKDAMAFCLLLSARTKRRYPLCTSQGGHNRRRDYHSESLRRVAFSSLAGQVTFRRLSIRIFSYVTVPVSATPIKARCLLGKLARSFPF